MTSEKKKDVEWGKRLQQLRDIKNLSQKELAASEIDLSYPTIQRYESGILPSAKKINEIVKYFKCSKVWLLTGEGVPYPDRPTEKPAFPSAPSNNIAYLNPASRILNEAIAEAGVDLNDAQKTALLKIIQDELTRTGDKVMEIIRVFKKEI